MNGSNNGKTTENELVAWLYIDCDEDKLVDCILQDGYKIKHGKSLTVNESEVKKNV